MYINCNGYADAWTGEFDFVLILLFNIMFNSIQNDYSMNISWDGSCRSGCSSVENLGPSTKISRGAILLAASETGCMTVLLIEKELKSIIDCTYIVDLLRGACYWNASRNIMFSLSKH